MPKLYNSKVMESNRVDLKTIADIPGLIYKPKKVDSYRIIDLYRQNFDNSEWLQNKIERMSFCSQYLELQTPSLNGELILNKTKVTKASFCRDRFCPLCSYRASRKNYMNLAKVMRVLTDCKRQFLFLTLTIPNVSGKQLKDTLIDLQKGWQRFYNNRQIKSRFNGFFRSLEVTYNKEKDTYHAHLHAIVSVNSSYFKGDNYLSYDKLADIWTRCNQKMFLSYLSENPDATISQFITYIKKCSDLKSACYELSKYCCKSSDVIQESFSALYYALFYSKCHTYVGEFQTVYKALNLNENYEDSESDSVPDYEWIITHWTYNPKIQDYIIKQI